MTEASWQEVWEIFDQALQVAPEERAALVQERCAGNPRLLEAVEELLAADRVTESFLDQPVASDGRSGSGSRSPAPDAGVLEAGTRLGPYRILKPCGKGGTSTVYLAERADDIFPRRVALKLVRPEMASEAVLHRLETERRILAGLDHPNIARLYDGGSTDEGLPYFVMEFVEGERIDAYCDHNQLTLDERLALFRKLCEPVQVAHQNLVVHRDIKPSNVLVGADGEPKLLDFGIAKLLSPEAAAGDEPTQTLHRMLTPGYASPEQLRGHLVTTASDVYSLGVLLYKLLTDQLPYRLEGRSPEAIEAQQMESEPLPPSAVVERKQLQGDLDAIVLKALRPAPRHRYSSVEQLAADLAFSRSTADYLLLEVGLGGRLDATN
ncbi:MAG: protein kinase, partial [Acidobacteriota bacterium]